MVEARLDLQVSMDHSPATDDGRPARVLLAEDDREMRMLLASALRRLGYEVVEAEDGAQLLDYLGSSLISPEWFSRPDIVVSDIRMPYWSGLDVVAGLRRAVQAIPVILITAFGDTETHHRARILGIAAVLDKPFDVSDFIAAVRARVPPSIHD